MKLQFFAISLLLVAFAATPASAQIIAPLRPYDPAVVQVAGRAEVYLPPDQARVGLSFYAPGRTAADATNALSTRTRALDAAVRAINPQDVTIERTDVTVRPVMREGGDRRPDRINGYEATANVTILVRDLALLSRAVETAVNAEPDTFNDVEFSIRDPARARRTAREAAITDAVDKARIYSEGAGHRLGRLLLVQEGANNMIAQSGNRGIFAAGNMPREAQDAVVAPAIAPEPLLYTAEVSVVFEVGAAITSR